MERINMRKKNAVNIVQCYNFYIIEKSHGSKEFSHEL